MKDPVFTGCAAALVTPFRSGDVDFPALEKLIEHQISGYFDRDRLHSVGVGIL